MNGTMPNNITRGGQLGMDYQYIVVIGTSTGGPKVLNTIIPALPADLPATYVVVQHMPQGFTKSLADRLNTLSQVTVKEAEQGETLRRGVVYIAPGGKQLKLINGNKLEIQLTDEAAYKGHRPAVNVMASSLAKAKTSKKVLGVILTGMGSDGLEGYTHLKETYSCPIIAQDEKTCVVYGMPKAVVNAGLAEHILPLEQIVKKIITILGE